MNVRLRKMNRPEEDISIERLRMRKNIEQDVDRVVSSFGFERVVVPQGSSPGGGSAENMRSRTPWKRNLQMYRRKEDLKY